MSYLFGLLFVIICVIIIVYFNNSKNKSKSLENETNFLDILNQRKLQPDQILFTDYNNSSNFLSVNEKQKKLCYGFIKDEQINVNIFDFKDILDFDVQVNDESKRKVSIGGVVVGAALAGGLGALIGSQSGNQVNKIKNINFLITVNNISQPTIKFLLLEPTMDGKGWDPDGIVVKNAIHKAETWSGVFNIIFNENKR